MLMTGRNYIIDTEDKRRVVREKEIKMVFWYLIRKNFHPV